MSKQYLDRKDGTTLHIGYVFQRRKKYDDCDATYLHETWVTLHEQPPTRTVKYHYLERLTARAV